MCPSQSGATTANDICHMSSGYIRDQLRHCSTDHVFLATDNQQPQDTTRILREFDGWRYKGRNAIVVDLMALAHAHKSRTCTPPCSSFVYCSIWFRRAAQLSFAGIGSRVRNGHRFAQHDEEHCSTDRVPHYAVTER